MLGKLFPGTGISLGGSGSWAGLNGIQSVDQLDSIWGDPGHSETFNVGVGIAKTRGGSTLGADLIYEPIGGENWFWLSNAVVRMGFSREFSYDDSKAVAIRLGLSAHSINYSMSQQDRVQATPGPGTRLGRVDANSSRFRCRSTEERGVGHST